jgi:hypothetical protein
MKKLFNVQIISHQGETVREFQCVNVDAVKSHTVFYPNTNRPKAFRIFDMLQSIDIAPGIIRLHYFNCYAEIKKA